MFFIYIFYLKVGIANVSNKLDKYWNLILSHPIGEIILIKFSTR